MPFIFITTSRYDRIMTKYRYMRLNFFTIVLAIVALTVSGLVVIERSFSPQSAITVQNHNWVRWQEEYGQTAAEAVVAIESDKNLPQGDQIVQNSGSGFIIDPSGLIVTNQHVIEGAQTIRVTLHDKRTFIAKPIAADRRRDMAVLKIDLDNLPILPFGIAEKLVVGEPVIAMGNPLGTGADGTPVPTFGLINRLGANLNPVEGRIYDNLIQTNATIMPGSSGGPLLNSKGKVVGINTAMGTGVKSGAIFGFAILLDLPTIDLIQKLSIGQIAPHAFLGVAPAYQIDTATQKRLGLKDISGALVGYVEPKTPANIAGIKKGDLIRSIGDQRIFNRNDLFSAINRYKPGQTVIIKLKRGINGTSKDISLKVLLTGRKESW